MSLHLPLVALSPNPHLNSCKISVACNQNSGEQESYHKTCDISFNVPGNTLGNVSRGIPTSSDIKADITNPIHHAPTHSGLDGVCPLRIQETRGIEFQQYETLSKEYI